jgi:hypothetical protein
VSDALLFESSEKLCEYIAEQSAGVCLLSFSGGKDSIAAWLQLRRYFKRIIPVYLYSVPGLHFVERGLAYFEDFFGTHIYRMPHPSMYRKLNALVFQAPERIKLIEEKRLFPFTYDDVFDMVRSHEDVPFETYTALGVRAVDSLNRWANIKQHGAMNQKRATFFPIYDWSKERLLGDILASGCKLPAEYRIFGRSFDGLDYRFVKPMKDYFPGDYKRVLEMFPMVELEILRMEVREMLID